MKCLSIDQQGNNIAVSGKLVGNVSCSRPQEIYTLSRFTIRYMTLASVRRCMLPSGIDRHALISPDFPSVIEI